MGKQQKEKKRKGEYGIEELMAGVPSSDAPREKAAKKDKSRALRRRSTSASWAACKSNW